MPLDRQLFPRDLAAALATLAAQKYPTAKKLAKAWGIDPSTAENLFKGHLSIPTLLKAAQVEGWGLWDALGAEITGLSYHQYEERKLQQIIQEAEDARQNLVRLRTRREALDALSRDDDDVEPWPAVEPMRARAGDGRRGAHQSGDSRSGAE